MAGALRKTMEYLGLAETDDRAASRGYYDEHGDYVDGGWEAVDGSDEHGGPGGAEEPETHRGDRVASVVAGPERRGGSRVVTQLRPVASPEPRAHGSAAEEAPELRRITTIHPRTYNEAKTIGENFRGGVPVIMNLTDMSDADAKRLVDFSAGLVFGLRGSIERVTNKVFLLSPEHVTVTGESLPARPAHLFNQS
jgi:cell division inhibitor SepF